VAALTFKDDLGNYHVFGTAPRRVVSLVPSDTLNIAWLGQGERLVGRTDYCELPEDLVVNLPALGGTKNPRVAEIIALAPDLVIANKEENTKASVEELMRAGIRVYVAFPKTVAEGCAHVARLARIFHVEKAPSVKVSLRALYEASKKPVHSSSTIRPRVFCPIWMKPLMTIHGDTYISDMLQHLGMENVFATRKRRYPLAADISGKQPWEGSDSGTPPEERDTRYPRITTEELVAQNPDIVLLPSEPHPFTEADAAFFRGLDIAAAKNGRVHLVDGKDLTWYGARAAEGVGRLRAQLPTL
jgi:ABC-type Fe3+-hydroxamate transport system substrate-binding protein